VLPQALQGIAGGAATIAVPAEQATTVGALLDALAEPHPALVRRLRDEQGSLRRYVNVYVDGEDVRHLAGTETPVPAQAEVLVLPSVAGG
jgi:molybdopterin synthase sulfur carrier subunit